jgi:hypothetical protein
VFLVSSSINPSDIARVMQEGYDVSLLNTGLRHLIPVTALYKQVASSFLGYRPDGHGAGRRSIHASPPFGAD